MTVSKSERICEHQLHFTDEEEQVFQTRYEENCDIFVDLRYVAWLKVNHPEIEVHQTDSLLNESVGSQVDPLDPIQPDNNQGKLLSTETMFTVSYLYLTLNTAHFIYLGVVFFFRIARI